MSESSFSHIILLQSLSQKDEDVISASTKNILTLKGRGRDNKEHEGCSGNHPHLRVWGRHHFDAFLQVIFIFICLSQSSCSKSQIFNFLQVIFIFTLFACHNHPAQNCSISDIQFSSGDFLLLTCHHFHSQNCSISDIQYSVSEFNLIVFIIISDQPHGQRRPKFPWLTP